MKTTILNERSRRSRQLIPPVLRLSFALSLAIAAMHAASSFAGAVPPQLLSAHDPAATLPAGGNDHSLDARISPDGRFVVFASAASDLAQDNGRFNTDVFLRDRSSYTTVLVSVNLAGTGGGNSHSHFGQISTNGRYVLFESDASDLVSGDTNAGTDIFMRDLESGTTELISKAITGGVGFGRSFDAVMTPDGRYVTFVSSVTNLVSGDANRIPDVFVRDMILNTNLLVSAGAQFGEMATPRITPDGRHVAFFSTATGMVASAAPSSNGEVYVRDLLGGTTTWGSTNALNVLLAAFGPAGAPNARFRHPSISDDGRFIAFMGGTNNVGKTLVLVFDQLSGATSIVSTNGVGAFPTDDNPYGPEITSDGRFIAYVQADTGNTNSNVYVRDSVGGTNILVSGDSNGFPAIAISQSPVITPDGQFVAFVSNATNLVTNVVSPGYHVYLRNLQTGTTQLVDADTDGAGSADVERAYPSITEDGRFVAFDSPDGAFVSDDNNKATDVFVRDTIAGTNGLISQRSGIVPATGYGMTMMSPHSISANGRWFVFESMARDLVPDDTNDWSDVFLRDLWTGETTLISTPMSVISNVVPFARRPVISGDGRYVAYVRLLHNGTTSQRISSLNILRWDRIAESNALVSVAMDGTNPAIPDCFDPVISYAGRYVAFVASGNNLSTTLIGTPSVFWRDMNGSTPLLIASGTTFPSLIPPTMSGEGRLLAYEVNGQLRVRDTQLGSDVFTNANVTSAAISPDGNRLLYNVSPTILVDSILPRTNLMSFNTLARIQSSGQWSSDGRHVVFVGVTNLSSDIKKIHLFDLVTSNITLVSFNATNSGIANAPSDMPVISGNGQFVVYRSEATDIVAGDTNPVPRIFLYNRLTGQNSILCALQSDSEPYRWISAPVVSAGAENVAFVTMGGGLAAPDMNRVTDAFDVRVLMRMQISPTPSPGEMATLTWQTVPERNYAIQYRDELNDPQWHDLAVTISVVGNLATASVPADEPNRFYRVAETE